LLDSLLQETYLLQINKMSEAKKEMPRIQDALKGELLKEHSLKKTEANEKNVLPSAERETRSLACPRLGRRALAR